MINKFTKLFVFSILMLGCGEIDTQLDAKNNEEKVIELSAQNEELIKELTVIRSEITKLIDDVEVLKEEILNNDMSQEEWLLTLRNRTIQNSNDLEAIKSSSDKDSFEIRKIQDLLDELDTRIKILEWDAGGLNTNIPTFSYGSPSSASPTFDPTKPPIIK
ncbi:MAG: hypothetical protein VX552_03795 [Chloroflexota bacterium]|nr:hypothetical protein [Chloroflexota bacterium]